MPSLEDSKDQSQGKDMRRPSGEISSFLNQNAKEPLHQNSSSYSSSASVATHITVDARERILQSQREAALRRRRQQFQGQGFVHSSGSTKEIKSNPRLVPCNQKYSRRDSFQATGTTASDVNSRHYGEVYLNRSTCSNNRSEIRYHQKPFEGTNSLRNEKSSFVEENYHYSGNPAAATRIVHNSSRESFELPPSGALMEQNARRLSLQNHDECIVDTHLDYSNNMSSSLNILHPTIPVLAGGYDDYDVMSDLTEQRAYDTTKFHHKSNRSGRKLSRSPSVVSNNFDHESVPEAANMEETSNSDADGTSSEGLIAQPTPVVGVDKSDIERRKLLDQIDWENTQGVKTFLMEPVPKNVGMLQCYVKRKKGKSKMHPEFRVYLCDTDRFLMSSKKRARKQASNYLVSMGRNDHNKGSDNIIGKLRANFIGTEFQIYDGGKNPRDYDSFFDEKNDDEVRSEIGAVIYSSNKFVSKGPRKMQVCMPKLKQKGEHSKKWQPAHKDEEMIQCFKHKSDSALRHLVFYENKQPDWNEDIGAYVLNFNNRVKMASVKNFQLVKVGSESKSDPNDVVMQFGKNGKDEFVMDVQWPMSLFQAFALALSSCEKKLACD